MRRTTSKPSGCGALADDPRGRTRRTWLRGRENVHKRYLVHVAGYNLGILS
jgi:hypothetical protein